jgi:hypothetical protein
MCGPKSDSPNPYTQLHAWHIALCVCPVRVSFWKPAHFTLCFRQKRMPHTSSTLLIKYTSTVLVRSTRFIQQNSDMERVCRLTQ